MLTLYNLFSNKYVRCLFRVSQIWHDEMIALLSDIRT